MSKSNFNPYAQHLIGTPFRSKPQSDSQARLERMHLRVLSELSLNRFKWMGVPPEIDPRFIETTLFYNAYGVFYRDDRFGKYVFTKATSQGRLNMYDNPTQFRSIAVNYPGLTVSTSKPRIDGNGNFIAGTAVPIWSNMLRIPDMDIVQIYASRLAKTDRTIDINLENARINKVIKSNKRNRLSMTNIGREVEQGNNHIEVDGQMTDLKDIDVLDMGINPDHIEKLDIIRTRIMNQALNLLGIDTSNQDKKERLVADEVNAGQDQALLVRYVNLSERQKACQRINALYGTKIWVEYNTEIDQMVSIPDFAKESLEDEGYEVNDSAGFEEDESQLTDPRELMDKDTDNE